MVSNAFCFLLWKIRGQGGVRPCGLLTLQIKKYSAWLVVIPEWKHEEHSTEMLKFPGSATACVYNKADCICVVTQPASG